MKTPDYAKPYISTEYMNIYSPPPDTYRGTDSICFKNGTYYENWISNDFTVIKGIDERWHIFGITHPAPPDFVDQFEFDMNTIHDAEWQLYHSIGDKALLKDNLYEGSFADSPKILHPQDRPGEDVECWAPCAIIKDQVCHLFYSPKFMRLALSDDMFDWRIAGPVFKARHPAMRDPFVFYENSLYYMIYVEDHLYIRTSADLLEWSEPVLLQKCPYENATQESPFLFKKDGVYYLTWCIYDGRNGCYDNRTFIYASESLYGFDGISPVTMLKAHASEIIEGEDGQYYIFSTFYPHNGVNMAKIGWEH
ncbi:MAG: glycoside hydrolase family protein [Saccharofermentanales bacterium]